MGLPSPGQPGCPSVHTYLCLGSRLPTHARRGVCVGARVRSRGGGQRRHTRPIAAAVAQPSPAPPLPSPAGDSSRARPRLPCWPCGSPCASPAAIYSSALPVFCPPRSPCGAGPAGRGCSREMPLPAGQQVQRDAVPGLGMCLLPPHRSRCFPYQFCTCFLPSSAGALLDRLPCLHQPCGTVCVWNKR